MLKDEIEKLIREGYLQDYIHNRNAKLRNDQGEAGFPREIRIIFGGPYFAGETRGAQNRYLRETRERPITTTNPWDKRPAKQFRGETDDITFSERDALHVCHPRYDALIIKVMIANNNVHMMLVANGSSANILYFQAFRNDGVEGQQPKTLT